jgi:hypothetical protein
MDLAEATRQPIPVKLAGKDYTIRPRTLAELGELQAWFKRAIPSPIVRAAESIEEARRRGVAMPESARALIYAEAVKAAATWPPRLGSMAWLEALDAANAEHEVVRFALAPTHPEVTDDIAQAIMAEATGEELGVVTYILFMGKHPDPKAQPPATTTT